MNVVIVDYDPLWPQMFSEAAVGLRTAFGDDAILGIEHIGSTSVPGLAAKPVIDIQLLVRTLTDAECAVLALEALGYHKRPFELDASRLYFPRSDASGQRTHHLHIYGPEHSSREAHLLFRDYLRNHADEAARYEALKRGLAREYPHDSLGYNEAKTEYILGVLEKAKDRA